MRFYEYVEDRASFLIMTCMWVVIQAIVLLCMSLSFHFIILISLLWGIVLLSYFVIDWHKKAKRMQHITTIMDALDKPYVLHEVIPETGYHEDAFYHHILYCGYKSMLEEVSIAKREQKEYREYVEQWVHEIKTPIAALKLSCENQQMERKRDIMRQLERTQHFVDQALFFARSENVEKDFQINRISLLQCIQEAVLECKYLCMQAQVSIILPEQDMYVYSDTKWLMFILCQLIENAVKYRRMDHADITFHITQDDTRITMSIRDSGIGIPREDLGRLFEKGFTGTNGRLVDTHATGLGLYLVARLTTRIHIEIAVESEVGQGTCFHLSFPK